MTGGVEVYADSVDIFALKPFSIFSKVQII